MAPHVADERSIETRDRLVGSKAARFVVLSKEQMSHRSGFDVPGRHPQRCCRSGLPRVGAHERERW
jgi:hypothetical protein